MVKIQQDFQYAITDSPSSTVLASQIDIVEDHCEGLCDVVAYGLLVKLDPSRATEYKQIGVALFDQFKMDIGKGYNKMRSGVGVRDPYLNESGVPFNGNRY